jgi:hypothetical protein
VIRLIQAQAEIVGLPSNAIEDQLPPGGDRRRHLPTAGAPPPRFLDSVPHRRLVGVLGDLVAVSVVSLLGARLLGVGLLAAVGAVSLAYYSICAGLLGRSGGIAVADVLQHAAGRPRSLRERRLPA